MFCDKLEDIYSKAGDIETIINNYDTLNCFKELNSEIQDNFIKVLKTLQYNLINNIEELQNNFIKSHFYGTEQEKA